MYRKKERKKEDKQSTLEEETFPIFFNRGKKIGVFVWIQEEEKNERNGEK